MSRKKKEKKDKNSETIEVLTELPFSITLLEKFPVQIRSSSSLGRHVVATRKIKAGKPIISDSLYTHSICNDFLSRVCNYCMKCTTKRRLPFLCEKCKHAYFCSEFCQRQSEHLLIGECNVFTRVNYTLLDPKDHADIDMVIRMILMGSIEKTNSHENSTTEITNSTENDTSVKIHSAEIHPTEKTTENESTEKLINYKDEKININEKNSSTEKLITIEDNTETNGENTEFQNSTDNDNDEKNSPIFFPHTFELAKKCESNMNGVKSKRQEALNIMARIIFEVTENSCTVLNIDLEDIILLLRLQETNVYGLYEKSTGNMHSQCLHPFGAMFNHSCWPNAAPTFSIKNKNDEDSPISRPVLSVVALRDIAKGEEINIRYGTPNKTLQARKKFFLRNYGFECGCTRCNEDGPETAFSCPRFPACIGLLIVDRTDDQEYWCTRCAMVVKLSQLPRKKRLAILNES